jgi:hypothetical protein
MFDKLNFTDFQKLINQSNFVVYDVYGPKPTSKQYKDKTGTWNVMGYFKD